MQAGDVVWDVGAHHGFVTLAASARVGARGWVHAFEPSAGNRRLLERHVRWNALTNTTVHSVALASYAGTARFGGGDTSKMHALGSGEETVTVDTGSAMVRSAQLRVPTFLKIDVEGAEADMLAGVREVLPSHARLVIAMHSAEADAACCRLLGALGFHLFPSVALQQSREGAWHGDPDLFAAGPAYAALPTVRPLLDRHRF
jgi:FkbM family methyltransferase